MQVFKWFLIGLRLDMAKRVKIFLPDPKNTRPEPNFFDSKEKRVDL